MKDNTETTEDWFNLIWDRMESAPHRRSDPWRLPSMATVSPEGRPEVRHVVLRRALRDTRILEVHSDCASQKYLSLMTSDAVEFCFWNRRTQTQVRLAGQVTLYPLEEAQAQWSALSTRAQSGYRTHPPPGQEIPSRYAYETSANARFIRLLCSVDQMDVLRLGVPHHQRMKAHWREGVWQRQWVSP